MLNVKGKAGRWVLWLGTLASLLMPALAVAADWDYLGVIDGVKVWRREAEGTNLFSFKGEITADVPIAKVLTVFLDRDQRKFWVDRFDDTKTLEKAGALQETYWIKFKLPVGISNRDYVLNAQGSNDVANGVFTARIKSVNHPAKGVDDCCIRGEVRGTYYRFEAIKGTEQTKMIVEVSTDPKGWLPGWLVNTIQKSWPSKTLNGLIKRSRNASVVPHPDYVGWHSRP